MAESAWRAAAVDGAVVPIGVGLALGLAAARTIAPEWVVGGAALVEAYPKNVEIAAATLGVLGAGVGAGLATWRGGRLAAAVLAAAGYATLAVSYPRALPIGLAVLAAAVALAIVLDRATARPAPPAVAEHGAAAGAWLLVIGALLVVRCAGPFPVDVFHDGEVLVSARDLLAGGRPFVTFQWPHGATDTGVAALWMLVTGKSGSSPMALAIATNIALSVPTLYLLARHAIGTALATALGVGVLAVACSFGDAIHLWLALRAAGMMVFVSAALALFGARPAPHGLLAGAALALGYVFRIDAGLFGALALATVLAVRALLASGSWRLRPAVALRGGLAVAAGAALAFAALRLLLGWPDQHWFAYTLGPLPRFHSITNGLPFPWPGRATSPAGAVAAVALALPAVLLAGAVRAVVRAARSNGARPDAARVELLVFLAVFAAAGLRTALGRSDVPHLVHWTLPVLFAAGLLGSADWLRRAATSARRAHAILAAAALILSGAVLFHPARLPRQFVQHLRPNPPAGECNDTLFTPLEAGREDTARFIAAACAARRLLAANGITRLVMDHSAPWYFVQFDMPLPSPYYAWYRACTPADQQAAIADVRRLGAQGLLQPRGFGAVEIYDVATAHLAPIVAAYLRGRSDGAPIIDTPIGRLVLWNAPPPPPAEPWLGPFDGALAAGFDGAVYDPVTRFFEASGWAFDPTAAAPLADLVMIQPPGSVGADVRRGFERGDVVALLETPAATATGWRAVTRLAPGGWRDPLLGLELVAGDGRQRYVPFAAMSVRELPRRSGALWDALADQVDAAEALGRADRAAALAPPPP